jgi:hypothetical protein
MANYAAREATIIKPLCLFATSRTMLAKNNGKLYRISHEYVANEGLDNTMAQVAKVAFNSCLHQALRQRVMLAGRGGQQHWIMSEASLLVEFSLFLTDYEQVPQQDWSVCNLNLADRTPLSFKPSTVSHACYRCTRCCHCRKSLLSSPWRARLVMLSLQ